MKSTERPLISFVLIAYKQEQYIREAIEGAFSQTYSPLEIIISDDCSSDQTFAIMQEMAAAYKGPHRIVLNRNEKNLGLSGHYNRVMELAAGEIIVSADGDDISMPERSEKSLQILLANSTAMCVSLALQPIDDTGTWIKRNAPTGRNIQRYTLQHYCSDPRFHINGAARAFRSVAFKTFGPLSQSCPTEDSTMLLRCLLMGDAYDSDEVGIYYRIHSQNISRPSSLHKMRHMEIYRQNRKDFATAKKLGLVARNMSTRISYRMRQGLIRRILNSKLYFNDYRLLDVLRIVISDSYLNDEKLNMFKQYVVRRIRKFRTRS